MPVLPPSSVPRLEAAGRARERRRRALPAALFALAVSAAQAGCRPQDATTVPDRIADTKPTSEINLGARGVQTLIDAMQSGDLTTVRDWMSPELRGRLALETLDRASARMKTRFGEPLGILEEQTHREGPLRWYSGLVVYEQKSRPAGGAKEETVLTPMLYQFAVDESDGLARLLIREHWFLENVRHPADNYIPVTRFHFPGRGEWYVLHGGRTRATNYHHGSRSQRFAYDLVIKKNGRQRPSGSPKEQNRSFYCHGEDLLAPAAGVVVHVVNDVPENAPGQRGRAGGNGLVIDHGFGEYSALWHAIPGSMRVSVGDRVEPGQVVGKVGNSGRSTGPHIHFHASYRRGWEDERFGIPAEFEDVFVDGRWYPRKMPERGEYVRRGAEARGKKIAMAEILVDA